MNDTKTHKKVAQKVAVFDFDKTIISSDSGAAFFIWRIKQSLWKVVVVILLAPIWLSLMLVPKLGSFVLKMLAWVAMLGVNQRNFKSVLHAFYQQHFSNRKIIIFKDALARLAQHQSNNDRIIVISGAPTWLVRYILRINRIKVDKIIGSVSQCSRLGIWTTEHCYGKNKMTMAKNCGEHFEDWFYGYTDSKSDFPVLERCINKYVINPNPRLEKIVQSHFPDGVTFELWQ